MFIPVTNSVGEVSTECTSLLTGDLIAECLVEHEEVLYESGEVIPVKRGDVIQLHANVEEDTDFLVTIRGEAFTWHIRDTGPLYYVDNYGQRSVVGEVLDSLRKQDGTSLPLVEGDPLTGETTVIIEDFSGNSVLIVNTQTGVFKRLEPGGYLQGAATMPGPFSGYKAERKTAVLTSLNERSGPYTVHFYDSSLTLTNSVTFTSSYGARSFVALDSERVLASFSTSPQVYTYQTVISTDGTASSDGRSSYDRGGSFSFGQSLVSYENQSVRIYESITDSLKTSYLNRSISQSPLYLGNGGHPDFIFTIDQSVSTLHRTTKYGATDYSEAVQLRHVPSSVNVLLEPTRVVVSYFDLPTSDVFDEDLNLVGTMDTGRTAFATVVDGQLVSTLLYSDCPQVSLEIAKEVKKHPTEIQQNVDKTIVVTYTHTAPREMPAKLLNDKATVTVNGVAFTGGLLPRSATIRLTIEATSEYYRHISVGLVSSITYTIDTRSEPKLFSDLIRPQTEYDALIKTPYTRTVEVGGLTEGFQAIWTSKSPQLTMSVNGSEYLSEHTVELWDTVELRWELNRLVEHNRLSEVRISTYKDNSAVLWDVIVMQLTGATFSKASVEIRHRFFDVIDQELTSVQESIPKKNYDTNSLPIPVQKGVNVSLSYGTTEVKVGKGTQFASYGNGEIQADRSDYSQQYPYYNTERYTEPTKIFDFDLGHSALVGNKAYISKGMEPSLSVECKLHVENLTHYLIRPVPNLECSLTYTAGTRWAVGSYNLTSEVRPGWTVESYNLTSEVRPGWAVESYNLTYETILTKFLEVGALFETIHTTTESVPVEHYVGEAVADHPVYLESFTRDGNISYTVTVQTGQGPSLKMLEVPLDSSARNGSMFSTQKYGRTDVIEYKVGVRYTYPVPNKYRIFDFNLASDLATMKDFNLDFGKVGRRRVRYIDIDLTSLAIRTNFEALSVQVQSKGPRTESISENEVNKNSLTVSSIVYPDVNVGVSSTSESVELGNLKLEAFKLYQIETSPHVGAGSKVHVCESYVEFRASQYSTRTVSEQDGMFATEQSAENYANSLGINLDRLAISKVGSVWVVRVEPVDELRLCEAGSTVVPHKSYGYLGGG